VELRNEAVQRGGKACFGALTQFEFFPKLPQFIALIIGQQAKQSIGCGALAVCFVGQRLRVINERIACIDLDDVVNQRHLYHFQNIDRLIRILGQQHCRHREMPAMLGSVFIPAFVDKIGSSVNGLQFIDLDNESNLLLEALGFHFFINHGQTLYSLMTRRIELLTLPLRSAVLLFLLWGAYYAGDGNPQLDWRKESETGVVAKYSRNNRDWRIFYDRNRDKQWDMWIDERGGSNLIVSIDDDGDGEPDRDEDEFGNRLSAWSVAQLRAEKTFGEFIHNARQVQYTGLAMALYILLEFAIRSLTAKEGHSG